MNTIIFKFTAIAFSCLLVLTAYAQSPREDDKQSKTAEPSIEETAIVWGTEVHTSSIKLQGDAMAIKQPDHISDLLRTIPGVDVGGAHSLNQRITMRSMDDKDLRITIDGANQNTYMYHHMGNLQIHADILKSVNIEVGTNSVVNGGLGGSARFETKDAKDLLASGESFGARVSGAYGDNASAGFSATGYGQKDERFDYLVYYHFLDRDNFSVGGDEIKDAQGDVIPGTDGEVRGLKGEMKNGLFKFGWNARENHRFEIGYESYADEGDYSYRPDMGLATDLAIAENLGLPLVYPTEFTRDTVTVNYEGFVGGATTIKATLFHNTSDLARDESGVAAVFGDASFIEGEAKNSGVHLFASSLFGQGAVSHHLNYGVDYIRYETQYTTDHVAASSEESRNTALFIEDRIEWRNGFTLVPGVRYDLVDLDSKVVNDNFNQASLGIAAEFKVNDKLLLRASGTQLFKAPEIGEVFVGAGLNDTPNPNIENEEGLNTEIGLAYWDAVLGADRFSAGFTIFQTDVDNYIYDYANADGFRGKDNVGDMQVDGLEAYLGYDLGGFSSLLTFSSADSELSAFEAYASLNGARLDRKQGDTFSLSLDYQITATGWSVHWDSLIVDDVPAFLDLDGASLDNSKDSYSVHNISARWLPDRLRGVSLTFGVDNLFDEYYASQSSRTGVSFHPRFGQLYLLDYEPGRNIKATLSYQF